VDHTGVEGGSRLDRLEGDVNSIRGEMNGLKTEMADVKADVRGLASILGRIEQGVIKAQERADHREDRARPSLVAVVSILITIIITLVGGAWSIGSSLAMLQERASHQREDTQRMWVEIDRAEARASRRDMIDRPRE
jgi:hypothetical protein